LSPATPSRCDADRLTRTVVLLIGLHSCSLGLLMLFLPLWTLRLLGFGDPGPLFFPSQSGIFLLILGVCYLGALRRPDLVIVILVSKAMAVAFLTVHAAFLGAPSMVWAAAAGDATMLAAILWALRRARRAAGARAEAP
jgi:hypothetical protein